MGLGNSMDGRSGGNFKYNQPPANGPQGGMVRRGESFDYNNNGQPMGGNVHDNRPAFRGPEDMKQQQQHMMSSFTPNTKPFEVVWDGKNGNEKQRGRTRV